ncbi:hypothetical protein [Larkinella terrae]|uniref:Glycosyltransferase RgtA/B/C/D-like domain-containing protein n=1 Tax=Larkinella terrae TaxID=2025311 RepID=A0A7K0ELL2_9BACT|nr:hypothetical protein [Larkinella terrae]MRS62386.1 hypothetical protein [Larkinella terrae]
MKTNSMPIKLTITNLSANEFILFFSLFTFFIIQKLPFILHNGEINPDESQMLTQAITLEFDPVFWRSVDGTTSGPINSYLLLLLEYIGFPFNYSTLHLFSVTLTITSLAITYFTLRIFLPFNVSFPSLFIIYSFFFFTNHRDFNHFNSELPSVMLLTTGVFILAKVYYKKQSSPLMYGALGVICCLVPLAKLQGAPLAFLYITFAIFNLTGSKINKFDKLIGIVSIGIGSGLVGGLLLYYLFQNKLIYDFYIMYVKTNLVHNNPGNSLMLFIKLIFKSSYDFLFFFTFSISIWVSSVFTTIRNKTNLLDNKVLWFLIINLIISFFVIARTGYIFEHYLYYTFFPITLLNAFFINQLVKSENLKKYSEIIFSIVALIFFTGLAITNYLKYSSKNQSFSASHTPLYEDKVINLINQYAKPTDCIVVWGWNLNYHVLTGLRQGTRENHSIRCMNTNSLGAIRDLKLVDYYRQQYVDDMKRNKPVVFIDEVEANSFFINPKMVVHQNIPVLRNYVASNYKLVSKESGVSVYVRKDRI